MVEQAVAELGGTPVHSLVDPELTVELPGFIPDDYVPDPAQRLELYKRLSSIDTDDELRALLDEIVDRYGPLPGDVVLLGELMAVKAIARGLGVQTLEISTARVAISCVDATARAALAAGWRKLADGRLGTTPPPPGGAAGARRALLEVVARAT
jgi:transcription-repair coupling factor (superfamily II helicase)